MPINLKLDENQNSIVHNSETSSGAKKVTPEGNKTRSDESEKSEQNEKDILIDKNEFDKVIIDNEEGNVKMLSKDVDVSLSLSISRVPELSQTPNGAINNYTENNIENSETNYDCISTICDEKECSYNVTNEINEVLPNLENEIGELENIDNTVEKSNYVLENVRNENFEHNCDKEKGLEIFSFMNTVNNFKAEIENDNKNIFESISKKGLLFILTIQEVFINKTQEILCTKCCSDIHCIDNINRIFKDILKLKIEKQTNEIYMVRFLEKIKRDTTQMNKILKDKINEQDILINKLIKEKEFLNNTINKLKQNLILIKNENNISSSNIKIKIHNHFLIFTDYVYQLLLKIYSEFSEKNDKLACLIDKLKSIMLEDREHFPKVEKKKKILGLLENMNESGKNKKKNVSKNSSHNSKKKKIEKSKRKRHAPQKSDSEYTKNTSSTSLFSKSKLSAYSSKNMTCSEKNGHSEILDSDSYAEQLSSEMCLSDLTNMNTKFWGIRKKEKTKKKSNDHHNDSSLAICKNKKENSYLLKKKKKIKSRHFGYNEKELDKNINSKSFKSRQIRKELSKYKKCYIEEVKRNKTLKFLLKNKDEEMEQAKKGHRSEMEAQQIMYEENEQAQIKKINEMKILLDNYKHNNEQLANRNKEINEQNGELKKKIDMYVCSEKILNTKLIDLNILLTKEKEINNNLLSENIKLKNIILQINNKHIYYNKQFDNPMENFTNNHNLNYMNNNGMNDPNINNYQMFYKNYVDTYFNEINKNYLDMPNDICTKYPRQNMANWIDYVHENNGNRGFTYKLMNQKYKNRHKKDIDRHSYDLNHSYGTLNKHSDHEEYYNTSLKKKYHKNDYKFADIGSSCYSDNYIDAKKVGRNYKFERKAQKKGEKKAEKKFENKKKRNNASSESINKSPDQRVTNEIKKDLLNFNETNYKNMIKNITKEKNEIEKIKEDDLYSIFMQNWGDSNILSNGNIESLNLSSSFLNNLNSSETFVHEEMKDSDFKSEIVANSPTDPSSQNNKISTKINQEPNVNLHYNNHLNDSESVILNKEEKNIEHQNCLPPASSLLNQQNDKNCQLGLEMNNSKDVIQFSENKNCDLDKNENMHTNLAGTIVNKEHNDETDILINYEWYKKNKEKYMHISLKNKIDNSNQSEITRNDAKNVLLAPTLNKDIPKNETLKVWNNNEFNFINNKKSMDTLHCNNNYSGNISKNLNSISLNNSGVHEICKSLNQECDNQNDTFFQPIKVETNFGPRKGALNEIQDILKNKPPEISIPTETQILVSQTVSSQIQNKNTILCNDTVKCIYTNSINNVDNQLYDKNKIVNHTYVSNNSTLLNAPNFGNNIVTVCSPENYKTISNSITHLDSTKYIDQIKQENLKLHIEPLHDYRHQMYANNLSGNIINIEGSNKNMSPSYISNIISEYNNDNKNNYALLKENEQYNINSIVQTNKNTKNRGVLSRILRKK
ncbi:conserved Plasmodium protein, unknown function [Plasmodium chabaudi chabaudi]|uniref:Uncharacterized protein n=1 Tax=Plasmodium chabaudi chabaudi TaxID=31271 RepID=A0A4V0K841_PLACU|nr:conserved Plasmodium protein, unknown function [Plasmodium chabaudi chabaudi]VTZ68366.1 conserved Plasmodium protein, unknown function [Plasmodium chabaudi chabaudi]|eukprot:XP_016653779.1 conserved Plasmodium protein, unknown function [Plasmodium chabaudi chabaudi]